MTYLILGIATLALILAVFGFIDRVKLEADIKRLDAAVRLTEVNMANRVKKAEAGLENAFLSAHKMLMARVVSLEKTAGVLASKIKAPFTKKSNVKKG